MGLHQQLGERLRRRWRGVRRAVLARRRLLAAVLAALAVAAALQQVRPPEPAERSVPAAARDLPAGTVLTAADVRTVELPAGATPDGVADHPVGRTLAAPVRAGEPLTDVRLVGAPLAAAYAGAAVVPVRLPDAGMAALLRVGDRVDLVAADPQGSAARTITLGARVVALPPAEEEAGASTLPGRLVVLAVPQADTEDVAQAAVTGFLTFTFSG